MTKQNTKQGTKRHLNLGPYIKISLPAIYRPLLLWLAPFLILQGFYCASMLAQNNYAEEFPLEFAFPTVMYAITALIIAVIVGVTRRPASLSAKILMTIIISLLMVNYDSRLMAVLATFRTITPILPKPDYDIPVISAILLALIFFGSRWVGLWFERLQKHQPQLNDTNVVGGLYILLIVLTAGQFIGILRVLPAIVKESSVQAPLLAKPASAQPNPSKPDIYYFVLDRYTNNDVLSDQFNFDNSSFTNFLRDSGFTVNEHANSNYPYTAISISSTMNAIYTNNATAPFKDNATQSRALYHNLVRQSSVVKALKSNGYKYHAIGSWYGISNKNPLADRDYMWDHIITILGHSKQLRDTENFEFTKSVYYRFFVAGNALSWSPFKVQDRSPVDDVRAQLDHLKDITTKEPAGGRFIFAHILVPHDPFSFNADGSLSTSTAPDNYGKPVKQKYVGQVQFINDQMKQIVQNIQKQSNGKAIILFNTDEGPYPHVMNTTGLTPTPTMTYSEGNFSMDDMTKWPTNWLQMKFGILQAAYIPGATQDQLNQLSGVNLFRIVLNNNLGYQLPYLPNCSYGLNISGDRQYNYADITTKLTGTSNPKCTDYQNLASQR